MKYVLAASVASALVLGVFGCDTTNPALTTQIKLVVPVGFRGGILIPHPKGKVRDRLEGVVTVKPDGTVSQDQAELFYGSNGYSYSSITWSDGKSLPWDLTKNLSPTAIGLRNTDIVDDKGIWEFVGNYAEWQKFMDCYPLKLGHIAPAATQQN